MSKHVSKELNNKNKYFEIKKHSGWHEIRVKNNRFEGRGTPIVPSPCLHAAASSVKFDGLSVTVQDYPLYDDAWGNKSKLTLPKQGIELNKAKFSNESVYEKEFKVYKEDARRRPYIKYPAMHRMPGKIKEKSVYDRDYKSYDDVWANRLMPIIPKSNLHASDKKFDGTSVYFIDFQ